MTKAELILTLAGICTVILLALVINFVYDAGYKAGKKSLFDQPYLTMMPSPPKKITEIDPACVFGDILPCASSFGYDDLNTFFRQDKPPVYLISKDFQDFKKDYCGEN